MKSKEEELCVSDMFKLAVLDVAGIQQTRFEYKNHRYFAYFEPTAEAKKALSDYEYGKGTGKHYRNLSSAYTRVKDRVFEIGRTTNVKSSQGENRGL